MQKLVIVAVALLAVASVPAAQQVDALKAAADTLGAASLETLEIAGSGANFSVGQNYTPGEPWPYLPKEKILAEADAFTPPAQPTQTVIVTAVPYAAALYDNIKRLNLDVQSIVPFHGARPTDVAELARNGGRAEAGR